MKILLFGKNGQVGWELNRTLQPLGQIHALGRGEADFSDPECLRDIVRAAKPDVIVNSAAYTGVDRAEEEESIAAIVNAEAPGVLAEEASRNDALLVHFSTDYVFNGDKPEAYTESDSTDPINAYGRTKLAGEEAIKSSGCDHLILRTSWVYASRGSNFLLTVLRLAKERDELSIVEDQLGAPTSARLIADTAACCIQRAAENRQHKRYTSGVYHLVASGFTSWHGFATAIIECAKGKERFKLGPNDLRPVSTHAYAAAAKRPANSRLLPARLEKEFDVVMPDWRKGLQLCIEEIYEV